MSKYTRYPDPAGGIKIYPSVTDFPSDPGRDGVQAVAADTNTIYIYDTSIPGWAPVANPGAAIAIDGLIDDVSATGPGVVSATVNSVGGAAAADIASATSTVLAATALATPNTLAKRDASANSAFNVLKIGDGTALAPSLTFSNSLSTGLYSSAANTLNLATNGVERMIVTSSGNIGINTSTPNSRLQIVQSGTQIGFTVFSTGTNNTAELYNQGTTNYTLALNSAANSAMTGASIGGYFARGTLGSRQQTLANDTLLSITASGHTGSGVAGISGAVVIAADENTTGSAFGGQVVIATTPNGTVSLPLPRLIVKNTGEVRTSKELTVGVDTTVGQTSVLNFTSNTSGSGRYASIRKNYDTPSEFIFRASNSASAAPTVFQRDNANESMRIDTSGNLGIGTSSPEQKLHVVGGIKFTSGFTIGAVHAQVGVANVITVSVDNCYVGIDCSTNAKTVNLPSAATAKSGKLFTIKDESGNASVLNITINANGTDVIDGSGSYVLNTNYESLNLVCDGAGKWFIT